MQTFRECFSGGGSRAKGDIVNHVGISEAKSTQTCQRSGCVSFSYAKILCFIVFIHISGKYVQCDSIPSLMDGISTNNIQTSSSSRSSSNRRTDLSLSNFNEFQQGGNRLTIDKGNEKGGGNENDEYILQLNDYEGGVSEWKQQQVEPSAIKLLQLDDVARENGESRNFISVFSSENFNVTDGKELASSTKEKTVTTTKRVVGPNVIYCISCQSANDNDERSPSTNNSGNKKKKTELHINEELNGYDVEDIQLAPSQHRRSGRYQHTEQHKQRQRRNAHVLIDDDTTTDVVVTNDLNAFSALDTTLMYATSASSFVPSSASSSSLLTKSLYSSSYASSTTVSTTTTTTISPPALAISEEIVDNTAAVVGDYMINNNGYIDLYANSSQTSTTTCSLDDEDNCVINHNITCVGDPLYCNYTYEEYVDMLYDYIYPTVPEWILIFSHAVVFFMGLVGNALVCIAVYTNYTMRTVTNIFIVNLAVADFFVILFCLPPTVVWDVTETWFMGKAMCKVVLYFQTVSVTVSVLTLTFISIDRWYAICFPLRYVSTNVRAIGSIAFIWIVALVSDIPEFIFSTTQKKELRFNVDLFTQCISTWEKDTEKLFYIARFVLLYILPLLMMTVAYYQIVRVLWKSDTIPGHRESRNTTYTCGYLRPCGPAANSSTMGQLRARRKAAKMLVAVVVMFASCFFPVHVLNILRYTIDISQSEVVAVLSLFSHWLCYANSAINPVIYNFMSGKFRREFRNALEKCRCGRVRVEDRSMYHSTPASRVNNISPSSRSNYQLTSLRDMTSLRDRQTVQTSFVENGGNGHHAQMTPMLLDDRLAHTKFDHNT